MNWKSILWFKSVGVALALVLVLMAIPGYAAAAGGGNLGVHIVDPIKTDAGYISGTMIGDIGKEVRIYRGIPYAAPPVGDLRWKPPQPVVPWSGIRECTQFGPWAPQPFPTPPDRDAIPESGMSEDCLHLNVLTPAKKTNDRLPVMVWFHGGQLSSISGNRKSYNTPYLPQAGVVLVTVSHRLGPIGYFAHPLLTAESPHHASGNYGQLDLIAALQWVKKNIAAFGGDPDQVMIFGQSGGARKVHWLMCSPLAKGLFQKAASHSSEYNTISLEEAEQRGESLAAKLGATDLASLRAKSWQEIIITANTPGSGFEADLIADGWSLPDTLRNTYGTGRQQDVPLIVGMTGWDSGTHFPENVAFVPTIRQLHSKVYAYMFTHVPTGWRLEGVKPYHTIDLPYLFGGLQEIVSQYERYAKPQGATNPDPGFDWRDYWLIDAMQDMWIQFAETGNPSVKGLVMWPPYERSTDLYLKIDVPLEVESGFSKLVKQDP